MKSRDYHFRVLGPITVQIYAQWTSGIYTLPDLHTERHKIFMLKLNDKMDKSEADDRIFVLDKAIEMLEFGG
jgi:tryptophanyl-tRNA synthetase